MSNECFVSWFISDRCNFKCEYCNFGATDFRPSFKRKLRKCKTAITSIKKFGSPELPLIYDHLDEILKSFKEQNKKLTLAFTGGEPLIYPDFNKILTRITEETDYQIAMDSNLSISPKAFMKAVPASRVFYITAALHITERERQNTVDRFITNVQMLLDNGYPVVVPYVLHPSLLDRFRSDFNKFAEVGIRLSPKPCKGIFDGKSFPDAYNKEAKEILEKYNDTTPHFPDRYHGKKCNAGMSLARINKYGDVIRCMDDARPMGNIFKSFKLYTEAKDCGAAKCLCFSPDVIFGDPNSWKNRSDMQRGRITV